MITISHNYAAFLLTDKVGVNNIETFLKSNNFKESSLGTKSELPTTKASDITAFFEKLNNNELGNATSSAAMTDLLKKQQLNNKLPKYLPDEITIAHKTGELGQYSHDAGIVYLKDKKYIIVIMTKSDTPSAAEEHISNISKKVYEYFSNE
jgi:beta-lactamase class A